MEGPPSRARAERSPRLSPTTEDSLDADAAYRGFLFADLRGFTVFAERNGNEAAADLLDAYRTLVRNEVARFAGAEIRTEGDSFYVVFRSAKRAVACALAIVAAADEDRRDHPDRPIQVGIGINAGETVQRDEGFVGTAVNLAARVCSQARTGEVLITSAVRDAVSGSGELTFTPRGRRRLKGIALPVVLFAVRTGSTPVPVRWGSLLGRIAWIAVAVAGLGIAGAVALLNGWVVPGRLAESAGAFSASPSAPSPAAAPPSASTVANPEPYPNAAERALLDGVGGPFTERYCERADEDDRPIYRVDPIAATQGQALRVPLNVGAGISCEIPSFGAPDQVLFWSALRSSEPFDYAPDEAPRAYLINEAGFLGIGPGDCSSDPMAYETWEFGSVSGMLLCRDDRGDAVIGWSYDGRPIYGRAVRRDGDLESLVEWWEEEARVLGP